MNRLDDLPLTPKQRKIDAVIYEESRRLWRSWLRRGGVWGLFFTLGFLLAWGQFLPFLLLAACLTSVLLFVYG